MSRAAFVAGLYRDSGRVRWAVLDTQSRVWYFVGKGRKFCEAKARELNAWQQSKQGQDKKVRQA